MPSFSPEDLITRDRHRILLGAVGPRPIALVSTVDEFGTPNLSPYSFFNIFSSNPPTLIFSPARRVRDNTTKDTLHNALREQEVVVNVVNYDLVQQVNLSSAEYPSHVDEFVKSGLTPVPSELVAPPRVAESPVSLECIVKDVVALGEEGGLDQEALDLVGRMGKNWWVRASGDALFSVGAPTTGIGVDQIPMVIRNSTVLTGNDLGLLGGVTVLPTEEEIEQKKNDFDIRRLLQNYADGIERREALHEVARELLENGHVHEAWKVLLIDKSAR